MVVDTTGHAAAADGCGGLSFAPKTLVATAGGAQAIVTLKVGEKVWSYNPTSKKMELQPILHVWINHDNDLVDLTITRTAPVQHSKATKPVNEVIHTNKKHPFLTVEKANLLEQDFTADAPNKKWVTDFTGHLIHEKGISLSQEF